jgi:hypothetical protein
MDGLSQTLLGWGIYEGIQRTSSYTTPRPVPGDDFLVLFQSEVEGMLLPDS